MCRRTLVGLGGVPDDVNVLSVELFLNPESVSSFGIDVVLVVLAIFVLRVLPLDYLHLLAGTRPAAGHD
jgi:hypothetical protein